MSPRRKTGGDVTQTYIPPADVEPTPEQKARMDQIAAKMKEQAEKPLGDIERRLLMYLLIKSGAVRVSEQSLRNIDLKTEEIVVTPEPAAHAYTIAVKAKD